LYFGMDGAFSTIPLARLVAANVEMRAVVVPASEPGAPPIALADPAELRGATIPLRPAQPNAAQIAWQNGIPLLCAGDLRHAQTLDLLGALGADVALVACFPWVVPAPLRRLLPRGFYNLHPSLLPRMRGPAPLFWVFREGQAAGVTLHRMSGRLDAGPVAAQAPMEFPDGTTVAEAEHACAQWGARLMLDLLRALESGDVPLVEQDESQASYYPSPERADFIVRSDWSVRRAYNFIRAMEGYGQALIEWEGAICAARALEYRTSAAPSAPLPPGEQWFACVDGAVRVRLIQE
jgi:methionyl-tRNA formyltransferase